jgi:pyruvate dehydrogenase E2 component (dihydrolipoamide acetyltransferase)
MATEITMPQLSDTMNAGKILAWRKNEGDAIKRGDILAEVETEKANLEIESFQSGTLLKIVAPAGTSVKVGEAIAVVGEAGESVSTPPSKAPPAAAPAKAEANQTVEAAKPSPAAPLEHSTSEESGRIKASPLARRIAAEQNIDIATVHGSGPLGRIVKRDIEMAKQQPKPSSPATRTVSAPSVSTPSGSAPLGGGTLTPLSKMRETIARRMQQTISEVPHFYVTTSVDMRAVRNLRESLKQDPECRQINVNHLVIKAAAYALLREPRTNCAFREGQLYNPGQINIGIITAVDDGLLIPVVRDADQLSLKDLAFEANAAIERARAGRPTSQDLMGGTFSISNMGMMDVENFTAIINPGQGAVLAVSSTREEPVVENGQVVVGHRMKVTLSVDHRIIDGLVGARFLKHFKAALEQPALMLL